MTRTPSRTATANDDGTYVAPHICAPRGFVGRQLQANLRSEEHESHMRQYRAGRGRMEVQNPGLGHRFANRADSHRHKNFNLWG